ncbi:hypothetical protein OIU76_000658 [Salix suchowensis]|nr:hypothetical protein OIU76_000658 [Salix suchowensis]
MGMQVRSGYFHQHHNPPTLPISPSTASILYSSSLSPFIQGRKKINLQRLSLGFSSKITAKSSNVSAPLWDSWKPDNSPASTPFSDIIWPSAGQSICSHGDFWKDGPNACAKRDFNDNGALRSRFLLFSLSLLHPLVHGSTICSWLRLVVQPLVFLHSQYLVPVG